MEITTVGIDLAKNVFQVHAIGSTGEVLVRRALRRDQVIPFFSKLPRCLIGMEACGTSHHWARELVGLGNEVRLMPDAFVPGGPVIMALDDNGSRPQRGIPNLIPPSATHSPPCAERSGARRVW